jgi:tetratricopeptide (TPR) repeat protein
MIVYKRHIVVFALCLLATVAGISQSVDKRSSRQVDPIERARQMSKKDPEQAIRILNRALQQSLASNDNETGARAYTLLGEIYEDIGQHGLALQRYQQAAQFWATLARPNEQGENFNRMGKVQVTMGAYVDAESSFQRCLEVKGLARRVQIQCTEGLADAKRQQGAFEQSEALYDSLDQELTRQRDSLGMARISAKRAQNFLYNNDYNNAQNYYNNSIQQLPAQVPDYEDYEPIEQANRALIEAIPDKDQKLDITQNTLTEQQKRSMPPIARLNEQMQLAELNFDQGRVNEAEEVLSATKDYLAEADIEPIKKASVYKLSSSIKLKKGDYEGAIEAYQQYISENDQALAVQEARLQQQAAVLKEQGALDLSVKDYLLKQTEQNLLHSQLQAQRIFIALLVLLLLAVGTAYILVRRKEQKRRRANNELEIKSLRAQMNPHFIFNALNSINNFIARQDERSANKYLADFARLMRMVLEHNQKDFITLEEEMRLLELYLKLEHARFGEKFEYDIHQSSGLPLSEVEIPPMLIQPFVENAIWHGLRYKDSSGKLLLDIRKSKSGDALLIKIVDNGIGRERSKAVKTNNQAKYKSTGLSNVNQRIALINQLYRKQYTLSVSNYEEDKPDVGTKVILTIPYEHKD